MTRPDRKAHGRPMEGPSGIARYQLPKLSAATCPLYKYDYCN